MDVDKMGPSSIGFERYQNLLNTIIISAAIIAIVSAIAFVVILGLSLGSGGALIGGLAFACASIAIASTISVSILSLVIAFFLKQRREVDVEKEVLNYTLKSFYEADLDDLQTVERLLGEQASMVDTGDQAPNACRRRASLEAYKALLTNRIAKFKSVIDGQQDLVDETNSLQESLVEAKKQLQEAKSAWEETEQDLYETDSVVATLVNSIKRLESQLQYFIDATQRANRDAYIHGGIPGVMMGQAKGWI